MPIESAAAPGTIAQLAMGEAKAARSLRRQGDSDSFFMDVGGGKVGEVGASDPFPVYSIPIELLADDEPPPLDNAVQSGWRVHTADTEGEQLVDLAEDGRPLSVRRGRSIEILKRSLEVADKASDPNTTYEARLLDFGQLGLSALWLHQDAGPDRFFSLDLEPREREEDNLLAEAAARARRYTRRAEFGGSDAVPDDIGG